MNHSVKRLSSTASYSLFLWFHNIWDVGFQLTGYWDHKSKYFEWDYMKHKMFMFGAWNSRQLSARMGEVCRHIPLPAFGPTWGHWRGGRFLGCCPVSVCLITCIASTTVGFPMTSLLRSMGDFPVPSSPVGIWGQRQHSLWQYPVVQSTGLGCITRFCANLPKTSSKGPQGCTGNRGRSRDVRQVVSATDPSFLLLPLPDNENQFMQDV